MSRLLGNLSFYYWLLGTTLGKELQEAMLDILTGVESLAVTIIIHGYDWLVCTMTSLLSH